MTGQTRGFGKQGLGEWVQSWGGEGRSLAEIGGAEGAVGRPKMEEVRAWRVGSEGFEPTLTGSRFPA